MTDSELVAIVVDQEFGEQLCQLPEGMPVWIVESPRNRAVVMAMWKERPAATPQNGITIFKQRPPESSDGVWAGLLADVDLHHGEYSQTPPYLGVWIIGAQLSVELRHDLEAFDLSEIRGRFPGFTAAVPANAI